MYTHTPNLVLFAPHLSKPAWVSNGSLKTGPGLGEIC